MILFWLKETLSMGWVSNRDVRHWAVSSAEDCHRFVRLVLPYAKIKRRQLLVVRDYRSASIEEREVMRQKLHALNSGSD